MDAIADAYAASKRNKYIHSDDDTKPLVDVHRERDVNIKSHSFISSLCHPDTASNLHLYKNLNGYLHSNCQLYPLINLHT